MKGFTKSSWWIYYFTMKGTIMSNNVVWSTLFVSIALEFTFSWWKVESKSLINSKLCKFTFNWYSGKTKIVSENKIFCHLLWKVESKSIQNYANSLSNGIQQEIQMFHKCIFFPYLCHLLVLIFYHIFWEVNPEFWESLHCWNIQKLMLLQCQK